MRLEDIDRLLKEANYLGEGANEIQVSLLLETIPYLIEIARAAFLQESFHEPHSAHAEISSSLRALKNMECTA